MSHILPPHLQPMRVEHADTPPRYVCNKPGEPMRAFPCLVAHPCSRAFRDMGPGVLYDTKSRQMVQPTINIRELALGYPAGCTAAPGVSLELRHAITGRTMDAYCMQFLFAICQALAQVGYGPASPAKTVCQPQDPALRCTDLGGRAHLPAQGHAHTQAACVLQCCGYFPILFPP